LAIVFLLVTAGSAAMAWPGVLASAHSVGRARALPAGKAAADHVVLVTLDGARWQEIFRGVDAKLGGREGFQRSEVLPAAALLPNIHRLFFAGGTALGDPSLGPGIEASGPHWVSMPGYLELLTGRATDCRDNACGPPLTPTLLDDVTSGGGRAAAFCSWGPLLSAAATNRASVYVTAGPTNGEATFPGGPDYRPDRVTAASGLSFLEARPPRFLWLSLGDTDEWAHRDDYREYLHALRDADRVIGEVAARLDALAQQGARTALLVTADHGRHTNFKDHGGPESAAVFLLARGSGLARHGATAASRTRLLRDVAPTVRSLLGLPSLACEDCGTPIPEVLASP
jgi:hypothetical protein